MKLFAILLLCVVSMASLQAQSLKKYPISNSGCSLYMYCNPGKFDVDASEDSSKVFTAECVNTEVTYGVICIQLLKPINEMPAAEDVMVSYLDYLKASFHVKTAAGYGRGHNLNNNENTRGIVDYWKDTENNNWKIKAWTDGKFIGVLYAFSQKELPEQKVNVFLDSFRVPGM